MKAWFKQNRRRIFLILLFAAFVIQVLIVPSIRPLFYEGRNYYVTYRIDGNNAADAVVFIPSAFMVMGFFTTLFSYPHRVKIALLCALGPIPVVLRRMVCWRAYSSILDNALYNLCSFALGVFLAYVLRILVVFLIDRIRKSYRRYRIKKNRDAHTIAVIDRKDTEAASDKPVFTDRMRALVSMDTVFCLLSAAVPLMISVFYSAQIGHMSAVASGLDEMEMTYMVFWLPLGYLLSGFLCALSDHPRWIPCTAGLLLVTLDTVYAVFDVQFYEHLLRMLFAVIVYLLIYGAGITAGYLIRQCIEDHKMKKQPHT